MQPATNVWPLARAGLFRRGVKTGRNHKPGPGIVKHSDVEKAFQNVIALITIYDYYLPLKNGVPDISGSVPERKS
jgi:hypothetical protein